MSKTVSQGGLFRGTDRRGDGGEMMKSRAIEKCNATGTAERNAKNRWTAAKDANEKKKTRHDWGTEHTKKLNTERGRSQTTMLKVKKLLGINQEGPSLTRK